MSAPRNASIKALRQLSSKSFQVRHLHMTGPATFPSKMLATDKRAATGLPTDLAGLRAECTIRSMPATGSKSELMDRLTTDSRSFSAVAMSGSSSKPGNSSQTRHINTSRALKSRNDTSTIDFAFLPTSPMPEDPNADVHMRMPLLHNNFETRRPLVSEEVAVQKPIIVTAAADATHISSPSPMSDVHDNAIPDMYQMAVDATEAAKEVSHSIETKTGGVVSKVWSGLLDDVFGSRKQPAF